MRVHHLVLTMVSAVAVGCGPHVVGTPTDSGSPADAGGADGGGGYPPGPYGVTVNRVIQDFNLPGYMTLGSGTQVNGSGNPLNPNLYLHDFRNARDANGQPYKYLLLDISAGWCQPCNNEGQALGLIGNDATDDVGHCSPSSCLTANWASRGGLFYTILEEGGNESTGAAAVTADVDKWINNHQTQSSMGFDPTQSLVAQGISPSAFPTNLVIDLSTMQIVTAWYGLDPTYQKWEAQLGP